MKSQLKRSFIWAVGLATVACAGAPPKSVAAAAEDTQDMCNSAKPGDDANGSKSATGSHPWVRINADKQTNVTLARNGQLTYPKHLTEASHIAFAVDGFADKACVRATLIDPSGQEPPRILAFGHMDVSNSYVPKGFQEDLFDEVSNKDKKKKKTRTTNTSSFRAT